MMRFCFAAIVTAVLLSGCAADRSGSLSPSASSLTVLQAGEWKVEDIGGGGVIDNSPATLMFGADGRLSGNASCNRLIAGYTVTNAELTISPTGTTMMACAPALMDQERKLLDLLGKVTSYTIDQDGTLVLKSQSGSRIVARR